MKLFIASAFIFQCLEETNAENVRIEQQVVMLRNKIHGGLVKSQSFPSLVRISNDFDEIAALFF